MPITPIAENSTFIGFGKESTPGTGVAATAFSPVNSWKPEDLLHYKPDQGLRGSYVDEYNMIQTQGWAALAFDGQLYTDVIGNVFKGLLGDEASTLTAGSSTTTTADAAAGATSISTTADPGATGVIQIGTGTTAELRTVTSRSGPGPYVVGFATGLSYAHLSGSTVKYSGTSPYTHKFSILNTAQPPTFSITDYNGFNSRRWVNCLFDTFSVKGQADSILSYSASGMGYVSATTTKPTQSFSSVAPFGANSAVITVAGSTTTLVENFEINIKRKVDPILAITGVTNPATIFANAVTVDGKATVIYTDDTFLAYYLNGTTQTFDMTIGTGSSIFGIHGTSTLFTKGAQPRQVGGKGYISLDMDFHCVANATDAGGSGGSSPATVTLTNTQGTIY